MIDDTHLGGVVPPPAPAAERNSQRLEDVIRNLLADFPQPDAFKTPANEDDEHALIVCQRLMIQAILLAVMESDALKLGALPKNASNQVEQDKRTRQAAKNFNFFASATSALSSEFRRLSNGIGAKGLLKKLPAQDEEAVSIAKVRRKLLQAMLLVALPGHWGTENERLAFAAKASGENAGTLRTRIHDWNAEKKRGSKVGRPTKFSDAERKEYAKLEKKFKKLGPELTPEERARYWAMIMFGEIMPAAQR